MARELTSSKAKYISSGHGCCYFFTDFNINFGLFLYSGQREECTLEPGSWKSSAYGHVGLHVHDPFNELCYVQRRLHYHCYA